MSQEDMRLSKGGYLVVRSYVVGCTCAENNSEEQAGEV